MNILFCSANVEIEMHTTTKLLLSISEELAKLGHHCIIAGNSINDDGCVRHCERVDIIRFCNAKGVTKAFKKYQNYAQVYRNTTSSKIKYAICHPINAILMMLYGTGVYTIGFGKSIKKIIVQNDIDTVICLQDPIWEVEKTLKAIKDLKVLRGIYQVDPWGMFDKDKTDDKARTVPREIEAINQVDVFFTTPVLLEQYKNNKEYAAYIEKMTALEFPNMEMRDISAGKCVFDFDESYINILYCGTIQGQYRNPKFALDAVRQLIARGERIKLYLLGDIMYNLIDNYILEYPDNFFHHKGTSPENCYTTMDNADVLLNIENTYSNMVPSKIFDYFASGKPILNIEKIDKSPSKKYFEKYPLFLTIKESQVVDDELCNTVKSFLSLNKNKNVRFEQVKDIFCENTPEFIAKKIHEKIDCVSPKINMEAQ